MTTETAPTLLSQLKALAASLRIEPSGTPDDPLAPLTFKLVPDLPNLQVTDIVNAPVTLGTVLKPFTSVTKNVRFSDAHPETPTQTPAENPDLTTFASLDDDDNVLGGMPINVTGFSGTPSVIEQMSKILANVTGTIGIPVTTSVPIALKVEWRVTDASGAALEAGKDYIAVGGLQGPVASLIMLPTFVAEPSQVGAPVVRKVGARVKLTVGSVTLPVRDPSWQPPPEDPTDVPERWPTVPAVEVRVPSIALGPLVRERFGVDAPGAPIPPAAPATPKLVDSGVDNLLTKLQKVQPAAKVELTYTMRKGSAAPAKGDVVAGTDKERDWSAWYPWRPGEALQLFMRPGFASLTPHVPPVAWTLLTRATVSGLPGGSSVTVELPAVPLSQLPLVLPTLVAAFRQRWWMSDNGQVLVFVHHESGLPLPQAFGDRKAPGVDQAKTVLLDTIDGAQTALRALDLLFGDKLGIGDVLATVAWITNFAERIRTRAPNDLVVTQERERRKLGDYDPGWDDDISSVFMIGPPDGPTLELFAEEGHDGDLMELQMPPGNLAASYWTIHESAFHPDHRDGFQSPPVVPLPGVEQEDRADGYDHNSMGERISSFRWA